MRIFIPSYNRAQFIGTTRSTVHQLRACGIDTFKVVVRPSQYMEYVQALGNRKYLLVLPTESGLNVAREFTRQLTRLGEWCLHMDDNVHGFIMPQLQHYRQYDEIKPGRGETMITRKRWQRTMNVEVTYSIFASVVVADTIEQATKRGAWLAGFSAHENPAFRPRKWADVGYVCGKTMLMRNHGFPWIQSSESAGEDYALTGAHLYNDGRVLINKWGHPMRTHYMPGGCGPYTERLPSMLRMQHELMNRFGALFAVKNSKRQGELRVRFNTLQQVAQWRSALVEDPVVRSYKL